LPAPADGDETPAAPGTLEGWVVDTAGLPIVSAQLDCGDASATSAADGHFLLELQSGRDLIVELHADGYIDVSRFVTIYPETRSTLQAVLMAESTPHVLDVSAGGTVQHGAAGAAVTIPPGSFVDPTGAVAQGDVEVYMTPYDPAVPEQLAAYPAPMRGLTSDGRLVTLQTFGVMDVTVRQAGVELQVKQGADVTVTIPAPTSAQAMPETSEMWTFDAARAIWVQNRDDATYDAGSHTFQTTVQHLTPLNCDKPIVPACLSGTVVDKDYNPVAGALVKIGPVDQGETSSDYTDLDGNFCLYVERDRDLVARVETPLTDDCPAEMVSGNVCVTAQSAGRATTPVAGGYPQDCSSDCKRLAQSIKIGQVDPGPLDEAACVAVASTFEDPFAGTCATGLTDFYECFAPEGACTYDFDPLGGMGGDSTTEFDNGSQMVMEFSVLYGVVFRFYGPDATGNPECGRMEVSQDGSETTITTANGDRFVITNDASGGQSIECEGGATMTLTPEQRDFLAGCGAAGGTGGSSGGGVECSAKPGTFGAECISDFECEANGYACCGGGFEEPDRCYFESLCDRLCTFDGDCEGALLCCNAGEGYRVCMPEYACY
jgi:hypothetical protein